MAAGRRTSFRTGARAAAADSFARLSRIVPALSIVGADITLSQARRFADGLSGRAAAAELYQTSLIFPLDLLDAEDNHYFMSFKFVKYEKRAIYDSKVATEKGNLYLPIPAQLNDSYKINYSMKELGPMLGSFVDGATLDVNDAGRGQGIAAQQLQNRVSDTFLSALSASTGYAINPFLTTVFKNPSFKTHSFSWKFIPKNEIETVALTDIITTIKYHMHPGLLTNAGVIFEYPEMVLVRIFPDDEHTYQFKPCVITDLNVNYAPSSGPSFFKSINIKGAPTSVEVKISLQEIEYFTKNDYID